jgi:AcrR family transcriptional regulator
MSPKQPEKYSKKQQQLEVTAENLFNQHGIKRVTIEEICRKAGVSKMTFYKYFDNKMGLVKHIWDNWIEEGFNKLDEINAMDISFPEKIERMFEWKRAFTSKMSIEFIEDFLHIEGGVEKVRGRFFQFIIESQKKGDIRPEVRPEFIMAVLDKLYELARDENLMKKYPHFIEFNRELKDFLWYGLLPRESAA